MGSNQKGVFLHTPVLDYFLAIKMAKSGLFLVLLLASTVIARPDYDDYGVYGEYDPCSIFFEDADKTFLTDAGLDDVTIAEKLTYGCSEVCNDNRNATGVTPLLLLMS